MNVVTLAMKIAAYEALSSPDTSTQNGAVLLSSQSRVIGKSCNRPPYQLELTEHRLTRPAKYDYFVHAEVGAILDAARRGETTQGATLVCVWAACKACALTIIEAGVTSLIRFEHKDKDSHWNESIALGDDMMLEAGINITNITLPNAMAEMKPLLRDGKLWTP